MGCRHSSVDSSAPSICHPGFESQANYLCFHHFFDLSSYCGKDENKQKEAGIGPLKKEMMAYKPDRFGFGKYTHVLISTANIVAYLCCLKYLKRR